MNIEVIILTAGNGTRMRSTLPKVLHTVGGKPMLAHVIETAATLVPTKIHVVVGSQSDVVQSVIEHTLQARNQQLTEGMLEINFSDIRWIHQHEALGSGHAAQQAMSAVGRTAATVLFLYGDVPLLSARTLKPMLAESGSIQLLTSIQKDPSGLGRIARDKRGCVTHIVEEKDADEAQKKICECNIGVIAGPAAQIEAGLAKLDTNNAQNEFYLTDIIGHAVAAGIEVITHHPETIEETSGVNSQADLAQVERIFQHAQARKLLKQGVRLLDPARFDVRGQCQFGLDCVVDANVILEGNVRIGNRCKIGANSIIRNSRIGDDSIIESHCVIDNAVLGARCIVGPFARLRPQTELTDEVRIGNFVEVKKSRIDMGSKVNHLSYIGDSEIGKGVNVGAGVITCNYDGVRKHQTIIGDDAFIGSNSELVAPLSIGAGATIGAGSTISKDVAKQTLAVARGRQTTVENWRRSRDK